MRSRSRPRLALWLAAPFVLFCASCDSAPKQTLNPVSGKVQYQDKPLKGCTVALRLKDKEDLSFIPPIGLTDDTGAFTISTGDVEGAPAGDYVAIFICSEEIKPGAGTMSMGFDTQDRFKGAYADKTKSKYPVTVKAGPNQLEPFNLK